MAGTNKRIMAEKMFATKPEPGEIKPHLMNFGFLRGQRTLRVEGTKNGVILRQYITGLDEGNPVARGIPAKDEELCRRAAVAHFGIEPANVEVIVKAEPVKKILKMPFKYRSFWGDWFRTLDERREENKKIEDAILEDRARKRLKRLEDAAAVQKKQSEEEGQTPPE